MDIQGVKDRQHPRPSGPAHSSFQILHHVAAHSGMAGKLDLTQARPTAMPADQGSQLVGLHDFSGEMGMELKTLWERVLNDRIIAR
jgi:hypothetical protein